MKKIIFSVLLVGLLLQSCKHDDDVYATGTKQATGVDDIIKIVSVSATSAPADTATPVTISVHILPDAATANRVINLTATTAEFINDRDSYTVTADAAGNAQFIVKSAKVGAAIITATIKTVTVSTKVDFVAAQPDDMLLSSDKYLLTPTESANLSLSLVRNPGTGVVSDPVKVAFSVTGTNASQLILPAFAYTTAGAATTTLGNPFGITGTFVVTATSADQAGKPVSRAITVQIK